MFEKLVTYIRANNYFGHLMFCDSAAQYSVLGHGATSLGRGLPNAKHMTDDRNPNKNTCPCTCLMYTTANAVLNGLASPGEIYIVCFGSIILLYKYQFPTKLGLKVNMDFYFTHKNCN